MLAEKLCETLRNSVGLRVLCIEVFYTESTENS